MSLKNKILEKEVGFFVENNIDSYRGSQELKFKEVVNMFLKKDGFFIITESKENHKMIGYLDLSKAEHFLELLDDPQNGLKEVKNLIDDEELELLGDEIKDTTPIREVFNRLENTKQLFFPVVDDEKNLIGRVSLKILKRRIKELYDIF